MKKKKLPIGFIIVVLAVAAGAVIMVKHFHIKGFQVVKQDVLYASGQPRGMDYIRLLYKYHIATIINVRSPAEHREKNWYNEEIIQTRNNGIKYIELPIDKNNYFPDLQTIDRFFSIMSDKTSIPVLLHGSGDDKRVAMLAAVWLSKNQKCSAEEIEAIVKKITDRHELTKAETEYINHLTE
jgi:protein tyrosine/serine phosphatase